MARIYKESRYVLQLLIGKSYNAQYDDVKISFYTKNPNNQVMVDNGITIKRNIAEVKIESTLFDDLEEGLISYIVYGTKDGIPFIEERQSNYFLKEPLDFKPTTCNLEDKSVTPSMGDRDSNNLIVIEESEGYDGLSRVVIDPQTLYNEGIEAGYSQGQADVAAKARVLNVTENGVYKTKFSDPVVPTVTGVYANGTDFYNYAQLSNKVFNTKIVATQDSRLEFWYKGDKTFRDSYDVIIGAGNIDKNTNTCFRVTYYTYLYNTLWVEIGNSRIEVENWDDTVWHHLIVSKAEGFWIDGEKRGDFSPSNTINGEFFINGISYDVNGDGGGIKTANGYFGMIKIDDVVIIPTADGFKNVNTGELLEVVKDGGYTFTENLPIYGEGELYKTINVNVPDLNGSYDEGYAQGKTDGVSEQKSKLETISITENGTYSKEDGYNHIEVNVNTIPKINVKEAGIKLAYGTFTEVPEWVDFEGITDMGNMFYYCSNLQTIPFIDTSNVISMNYMFGNCSNLQTIPPINTSNVIIMDRMFQSCTNLKTLPELDASKVTNINNYFRSAGSNVTDVGGWKNLKMNWNDNYGLVLCPNLTYQSCINILNGLYDFTGNGETPNSSQGHLKVHANFLTTVGDEISIGVAKGWSISA